MWQMQQQQTQQQYLQQPNPRVIRQQQLDLQKWQQQQLQQQHLHQLQQLHQQQLHQQQLEEDKSKQQRILQQEFQIQLIPQHQLQQQQMQLQQMSQQQLQQQQIQLQRLHQQQAQQQQLQVQQLSRQQQERQPLPLQVPQQQMQQHQRQRRQQPHQQQRLQCQQQPQHEQQYQQQQLQQQQRRQQPQPQQQSQHPQQQQQQRPQQQPQQHLQQQSQLQNQQQRPQQQPRHQQQNQQHPQPQPQHQQPRHQQQNQQQHLQHQPQHQQQNQQQQRIIQLNNNDRDQEIIYQNGLNNNLNIMETAARPSNPRAARNMAEKQRRDNLNGYIAAMAASVPILALGDCRKRDKISILRLTGAHCRLQYTMGPIDPLFRAPEFMGVDLERTFVNTDPNNPTFVLVLNAAGTIVYISKFIQTYLSHDQYDMLGDSLYNYVYEDDHIDLAKNLSPADCFGHGPSYCSDSLEVADDSREKVDYSLFVDARRHFNIRLAHKATSRREQTQYEYIQLNGLLTLAHKVKRSVRKGESIKVKTPNDIIFICTARMLRTVTIAELALLDFNKNEYFTRHLVDGRIIFCDHRISVVAGYMCHEVYGTSAFKFMHKEDVRWTIIGLRQMYDQGKHFGSSCYRLINKIGNFIYLRTHGYLEVDEQSRSVCSFICLNTLMSEEEGKALIRDMKDRYSAKTDNLKTKLIRALGNEYRSDSSSRDTDSSSRDYHEDLEDASQLEDAINHLITDLPSQVALDYEHLSPGDTQSNKVAAYSSTLPPAKFQAAAVGITKTFSYRGKGGGKGKSTRGGKNGKGKPDCMRNQEQSTSDNDKSNEEDRKSFPGKKIPELDSPSIPVKTIEEPQVRIAGKDFSMAKACGSQTYSETVGVEDIPPPSKVQIQEIPAGSTIQIQEIPPRSSIRLEKIPNINAIVLEGIPVVSKNKITAHTKPSTSYEARGFMNDAKVTAGQIPNNQSRNNLQQASLKRVHNVNTDNISKVVFKKRATEDIITLELPKRINGPILTCENGEVLQGCPTFIEVHPMSYNPNMQEPPNYTLDEFQDMPTDTLITTTIDNSPEMMQLLSNIPDMTMEGNSGEPNVQ